MHSIYSITQSCICHCLLQPLTCLNHDATAILPHLIYLYSIDCTQVRSAEYDPNSPIAMPVCMSVCSRKTLFSLFAQTFHSFVLFFSLSQNARQINTAGIGCRCATATTNAATTQGQTPAVSPVSPYPLCPCTRIRVDATPAATKTKNALRLFFLLRFVLDKFNSRGMSTGASRGGGTLTLEGTKRNTAACLGASYSGTKTTTKYRTFRESIVYSHLVYYVVFC